MAPIFEPGGFSILDVENLRLHYRETCRDWLSRFDRVATTVAKMYDASFVRAWRLYLAGSIAAFEVGTLQLFQVLFAPPGNNEVPWSRAYLYE
jgi:cyclopropane-fatty-acyl-phospholipid synthase